MATEYQIELRAPHVIEKGVDSTIEAPVTSGAGATSAGLIAPTAGTVTVYDGSGTAVVDAQAVTVTGGVATYTIAAATTGSLNPSSDWWVLWSLTVDGQTVRTRNQAALVAYQIRPMVSNRTILKREPTFTAYPAGETSWQDQIEEAWDAILNRLYEEGKQPHRIVGPAALRETLLTLSLAVICEALATYIPNAGARFVEKARMYREQYEAAWGRVRYAEDTDDDGDADIDGQSTASVVYLSRPPRQWRIN